MRHKVFILICFVLVQNVSASHILKENKCHQSSIPKELQALKKVYSSQILSVDSVSIVLKSGKRILFSDTSKKILDDDGMPIKATLQDQMSVEYFKGRLRAKPLMNYDPGRMRCEDFFNEIYGKSESVVRKNCVEVKWIDGTSMLLTTINGVDKHLRTIIEELKSLPPSFRKFLVKPGGSLASRNIAGTLRKSAHSYGIAIDINVSLSDYWRNTTKGADRIISYKNKIPFEIVSVFEKHGFIWGGKWYHYDTMHFEFRPELCKPECGCETN